jgi:hypothetical protein
MSALLLLLGGSIWLLFLFDAAFVGFGDAQEWERDALIPAIWMSIGGAIAASGFVLAWRRTGSGWWLLPSGFVIVVGLLSVADVLTSVDR